jgi:hypothetical protein
MPDGNSEVDGHLVAQLDVFLWFHQDFDAKRLERNSRPHLPVLDEGFHNFAGD